jgi:hypothetical protein
VGSWKTADNIRDARYVHAVALEVVTKAGAVTDRDRIIALRDYLRTHVDYLGLRGSARPFLRDGAAETLRSGKGYCGEVSRAFIVMAHELGIRAQRVYLYGKSSHVVAEAEVSPNNYLIVDALFKPSIVDLEPLDRVILRPVYAGYYTVNIHRLHVDWLVLRLKLKMGPLTYWLEQPNLIKAVGWFGLAFLILIIELARMAVGLVLRRLGWVHVSDQASSGLTVLGRSGK